MNKTLKDILIGALKEVLMYAVITILTAILFDDNRRYVIEDEVPYWKYGRPRVDYSRRKGFERNEERKEKHFGFTG